MTTLIFHVGMAKTGSSSLQQVLSANRDRLLEHGVLFPRSGRANHKMYALAIMEKHRLPRHMLSMVKGGHLKARLAEFHQSIVSEVKEHSVDIILLSSETMFASIRSEKADKFKSYMSELAGTQLFQAYIRLPASRYLSGIQQQLKSSFRFEKPKSRHYRRNVLAYKRLFGEDSILLRPFDFGQLVNGSVVDDFFHCVLKMDPAFSAGLVRDHSRANISLSGESMLLMQSYRQYFYPYSNDKARADSTYCRTILRQADDEVQAGRPRLRPEIADSIDYCSCDILWLRDNLGLQFSDYDYKRVEDGRLTSLPSGDLRLQDMLSIRADKLREIMAWLSRHEWINQVSERIAWLNSYHSKLD